MISVKDFGRLSSMRFRLSITNFFVCSFVMRLNVTVHEVAVYIKERNPLTSSDPTPEIPRGRDACVRLPEDRSPVLTGDLGCGIR